ncbi:MAG: hypothetical protein L7F77_02075 [Candidatus Magnetominusculus sp. LBB02]|nr:hypothetical protein [Candidatus Magnetominusculus sp. LBB02]
MAKPFNPLHYLYERRFVLVRSMFYVWLLLAGYWLYCLWGVDCAEVECLKFVHKLRQGDEQGISARSALSFILWALTSGIFVAGIVVFILKFAYNCVMDTIKGIVPHKTQDFVIPTVLIVLLWPCFAHKVEIKSAYRTIRSQASEIVTMALGYEVALHRAKTQTVKSQNSVLDDANEFEGKNTYRLTTQRSE